MTALNAFVGSDAVHVFTDGARFESADKKIAGYGRCFRSCPTTQLLARSD
jgi:hypothetical protein